MRKPAAALLVSAAALLGGCSSLSPDAYRSEQPRLDVFAYFDGTVDAWGQFEDRSGKVVKRFQVLIRGTVKDDRLTLEEDFAYSDGTKERRVWTITRTGEGRYRVIEWLMWQMGGPGPMFGQVHHFVKYNKGKAPYAEERYLKEAHRLYGVLDRRLAGHEFVADAYSIADIAIWPWVSRFDWQTVDLNQYANVKRWYLTIANRPAVQRGYKVPKDVGEIPIPA